jgi:antitoxin Phd
LVSAIERFDQIKRLLMRKASKKEPRVSTPKARIGRAKEARHSWKLQTAKARLSEVFRLARTEGPQLITRHGKEGVVMLPVEQFDQLIRSNQPTSLVRFFRESPFVGVKLDLERDKDAGS